MNFLEERIVKDGIVKSGNVLKVDSFLNHQMDIALMEEIGREFKRRFGHKQVDKVLPKRILDGIIEMIYALDKVAPGTANDDTLLYGVEVKFYNMEVKVNEQLETCYPGLYIIGDGSGITHSLSHASASGVHVARNIVK